VRRAMSLNETLRGLVWISASLLVEFERSSPSTKDEPNRIVDPDEIVHPLAQQLKLVPFESGDASHARSQCSNVA
jgi:hypothetical protein